MGRHARPWVVKAELLGTKHLRDTP